MTEPAVRVDDVSKRFRLHHDRAGSLKEAVTYRREKHQRTSDFWAVRDVSFDIAAGSSYGLIGHNGSGKSTLLRLIAGIHPPTSGKITTVGRISALLELGAGFHPELSGRENIYLNGSILGLKRREVRAVIDDIVAFAGLEQFIDSPVKVYSSGMYVRLGFSVAVHVKPDILLIDEVIAVGDEEFQRRCFDHLYKLRRDGVTIVMVSHAAPMMESMCDRVAWLDHGKLVAEGKASDVVRQYLAKVNVDESQRIAAEHDVDEPEPDGHNSATRRGTGEIRIDDLEYLDGAGRPRATGSTGDPLVVRIHFTATRPIHEPVFGLAFRHEESGAHIAGPNTRFGGTATGDIDGKGWIDYVLDPLPLMPGSWRLSVAVVDEHMQHTFDQLEQTHTLRVQPGSSAERYGLVDLHGEWRVPTAEARRSEPVASRDG